MYLLYNLGPYRVRVDEKTLRLELKAPKARLPYAEAEKLAAEAALFDSDQYGSRSKFIPRGTRIGEEPATTGDRP